LSPELRAKILTVPSDQKVIRAEEKTSFNRDIRIIATTTQDIFKGGKDGWFSKNPYYFLNVILINLPPLRERKEDIPMLVEHFITKYNVLDARNIKGVSEEAISLLMKYDWPGNVEELENLVERAMLVNETGVLAPSDFPPHIIFGEIENGNSTDSLPLQEIERQHIERVLQKNNWNIKKSAELLKIDRVTLYSKIKKFKLLPDSLMRENEGSN
jgi:transcriptional regulator with PAS, ATPase and Fis domain